MSRYLIAAGLARLADDMVAVAFVLLVIDRTGRPALAGAMVTGYTLPALVSGPLLGVWLDRSRRQRIALAANEAVLAGAALGLVAAVGRAPAAVCVALAAAAGVTLPLTGAGFTSMVPRLVAALPPGRVDPGGPLRLANTLDALTFNGAAITGPALAAGLAALDPTLAPVGLAVIALAGLVATLALPPVPGHDGPAERLGAWRTVLAGVRQLARTPPLRGATVATALGFGSVGALTVTLPLFTTSLGAGPNAAGLLWTALEVGGIAGTVAIARLAPAGRPHRRVLACTALFGLVMATWPLARSLWVAIGLVALAGLPEGPILPATFAVRQRYAPPHLLAQLSTTAGSLKLGGYAVGAALAGIFSHSVGPRRLITTVAAVHLLAAGLGWLAARGRPPDA